MAVPKRKTTPSKRGMRALLMRWQTRLMSKTQIAANYIARTILT